MPTTAFGKMRANRCKLEAVQEFEQLRQRRRGAMHPRLETLEREADEEMKRRYGAAWDEAGQKIERAMQQASGSVRIVQTREEPPPLARRCWDAILKFLTPRGCC